MLRSNPWHLALVGILLIVAGAHLSGCASTNTTRTSSPAVATAAPSVASAQEISGTYTLETINGASLPYTMTHEPPGVRVTSGAVTINPDGTCTGRSAFELPSGEPRTRETRANWTREGDTLRLSDFQVLREDGTWQDVGTMTGTLGDDTFTMENEGQVLVYRRGR